MVRYFYAWTPLVIVTAVFLLSAPWLGLIALMIVSLVALAALAALAWAVVVLPLHMLSWAMSRRSHSRSGARRVAPAALAPARRPNA
jgi:membrane protein implicated in regulation of membrane protease activity